MKIDLTWGESLAVREQLIKSINLLHYRSLPPRLEDMNYMPFEGDETLLKHTREVIKRQYGKDYKYVVLTNGAAGGCVITMRAYRQMGRTNAIVQKPPFFSLYPSMIAAAGLKLTFDNPRVPLLKSIFLLDSPSNPTGNFGQGKVFASTIWDAVYGNYVYCNMFPTPHHDVLVGSYSKLTGLNGIRIGWIATDDPQVFQHVSNLVAAEYCGLSTPSVTILNDILPNLNWDRFETGARASLDLNREAWSKLERYFGGQPVPSVGMFYYGPMDAACKRLFEKSGIVWTPGNKLLHEETYGRFNIGSSRENIYKAVASVLKNDTLP